MWKQLCRSRYISKPGIIRNFLSDEYRCSETWQNRLQSPILQQIRPDQFYYELDRKFQQNGKVCAVDIDIFANALNDNTYLTELSDIVHKLRLTAETDKTLASTSHAVVRHHLDFGNDDLENLIYLLDDRLSYGVFLDVFTANLFLDKLLKLHNYRMAAKVATFLMLQEKFDDPINRVLSLYACYKYLEDPQPFEDMFKRIATEEETAAALEVPDPKAKKSKRREKKEELRIRINFLRNPYFDDHFDLRNSNHLVGKTFLAIARYLDGTIKNSMQLLGYTFYEKFAEGNTFFESLDNKNNFHKDAVEIAKKQLAQV